MKIDSSQKMVGLTCIDPVYENKLNELNVRYQKLKSKSGKIWLKIFAPDEEKYFDFFHSIPTYVNLVLDD
tara:strand:- start:382 stop:591 length:210 start_codon:yes stop_codon:yes gene_type:complete